MVNEFIAGLELFEKRDIIAKHVKIHLPGYTFVTKISEYSHDSNIEISYPNTISEMYNKHKESIKLRNCVLVNITEYPCLVPRVINVQAVCKGYWIEKTYDV